MDRKYWTNWAQTLQQKRLTGLAGAILEGAGPFRSLFSQVMLGFLPLFGQYRESSWQSFAQLLENPKECQSFTAYLLEEKHS
jgi:hypothetical protein